MNLGFSIGTCDAIRSCFGGGGLGGVNDALNPQVTRRIKGILVRDILLVATLILNDHIHDSWPFYHAQPTAF